MAPWLWAQLCLFIGDIDMIAGRRTGAVYVVAVQWTPDFGPAA
jgi:hypothetical protein